MVGSNDEQAHLKRFKSAARALGCDEDKEKFEAQLGKIAEHKPAKDMPQKAKRPTKKVSRSRG
jgi:branched-subunit amino acid aminotransferase/4-amino-4-deoxychorismate lyase